ncbi:ABC transporter permease [Piscinibacter sp.]|uniref:ABC transporter permease n=1 Tax=Piscinibacter sp. TaxID=1903157 RepID=UPI002F4211D1
MQTATTRGAALVTRRADARRPALTVAMPSAAPSAPSSASPRKRATVLLVLPALVLLLPFLAAVLFILRYSVSAESQAISGWSLAHYGALFEPFFLRSVLLTLKLATVSTLICMALAVPIAMLMAALAQPVWRRVITSLVLLPMILNLLIQSYGWMMVLGPTGVANTVLMQAGVIDHPLSLLFNEVGVLVGLVQTALPLAVFPVLGAMRVISQEYLEAAGSMGATPWRSFFDVTLPLLKPGLISAASIVFAYNASAFAVPLLLGGRKVQMMGVAIRDMISPMFDWGGAAAAGVALILITLVTMMLATWLATRAVQLKEAR